MVFFPVFLPGLQVLGEAAAERLQGGLDDDWMILVMGVSHDLGNLQFLN